MSPARRKALIEPWHLHLSIARQCRLARVSRSTFYSQPRGERPANLALMRVMDRQFLETPWYGARQMTRRLATGSEARAGIGQWIRYYNTARPHPAHGGATPWAAYRCVTYGPSPARGPDPTRIKFAA